MKNRTAVLGLGGLVWILSVGCGAESSTGDGMAGAAGALGVAGKTARPNGQGGDSGDDTPTGACEQGDTRACLGPARCNGAQFCDGVRWSECDCGDAVGGTGAGGTRPGVGGVSQGGKGVSFGGTFGDAGEGPLGEAGSPRGGSSGSSQGGTRPEAGAGNEAGAGPTCGAPGQACCSGTGRGSGTRCQKNYQCSSTGSVGKCVQCGATWQACCIGSGAVACREKADECFLGQCEGSGGFGGAF